MMPEMEMQELFETFIYHRIASSRCTA